nr:probable carboxylesterase 15 [Coffea arabica]
MASEVGWQRIEVQSDCKAITEKIHKRCMEESPIATIMEDIGQLSDMFQYCTFSFVYRDGNRCARKMAQFATELVSNYKLIFQHNIPIHEDDSIVQKDCQFDSQNNLYLRLYKPVNTANPSIKLPVVYFLHGRGFCVGSFTGPNNHNACLRLASGLQALVVAPDYRLAPEHRLPAAMDDAVASLKWLQAQAISDRLPGHEYDTWLHDRVVDFDQFYIIGDSSGGYMAHNLAVQHGPGSLVLAPVCVRGYVLMAPFFGGTLRTKSEAEGMPEPLFNVEILDRFWRLSLSQGKNADHPLANPFGTFSQNLESVMLDPVQVITGGIELPRDRVENYARRLKEAGKEVQYVEIEGDHNGFFINDPSYIADAFHNTTRTLHGLEWLQNIQA